MEASEQEVGRDGVESPLKGAKIPAPAPRAVPSLWAVTRGVLFFTAFGVVAVLAGRRWAEAYARYRVFHAYDPAPLSTQGMEMPTAVPASDEAEESSPKQPRAVLFRLEAPDAKTVLLGGTFNGFDAGDSPLARNADGVWETTLSLLPGRYHYKFKVDGRWSLDPANPEKRTGSKEASILDIQ